jgi:hypothetical protein
MDGAAVGGARLAAVLEEKERAPALALGAVRGRCRSTITGLVAVLEEKKKTPALALGAVRGWCRSRGHSPGGSAGREGEDTSTSLGSSA